MANVHFVIMSEDSEDVFLSCWKAKAYIAFCLQAKFISKQKDYMP